MIDIEPLDNEASAADVGANAAAYTTGICPSCGQEIPPDRLELHLSGLDGARPECPRQDLEEIAERARAWEREHRNSGRNFWRRRL
jgi:hypothetical protein